jgi:hypothetical protein
MALLREDSSSAAASSRAIGIRLDCDMAGDRCLERTAGTCGSDCFVQLAGNSSVQLQQVCSGNNGR